MLQQNYFVHKKNKKDCDAMLVNLIIRSGSILPPSSITAAWLLLVGEMIFCAGRQVRQVISCRPSSTHSPCMGTCVLVYCGGGHRTIFPCRFVALVLNYLLADSQIHLASRISNYKCFYSTNLRFMCCGPVVHLL